MTRKVGTFGDLRSAIHSGEIFSPTAELFQNVAASEYLFAYLRREAPRWAYEADAPALEPLVICGAMRIGSLPKEATWERFGQFFAEYVRSRGLVVNRSPEFSHVRPGLAGFLASYDTYQPPPRLPPELLLHLFEGSVSAPYHASTFESWWAAHGRDMYGDAWMAWLEKNTPAASAQPKHLLERLKR